ncbi:MAG: hypothetical protein ACLUEQ_01635 [Cloacibacillus evryensis]
MENTSGMNVSEKMLREIVTEVVQSMAPRQPATGGFTKIVDPSGIILIKAKRSSASPFTARRRNSKTS